MPNTGAPFVYGLVAGLGQIGCGGIFADDGDPTGLRSLPGALIAPAGVGPVDHLIAVDRCAVDDDTQRGSGDRLEAHRDPPEVKVDVGHDLAGLHGDGV